MCKYIQVIEKSFISILNFMKFFSIFWAYVYSPMCCPIYALFTLIACDIWKCKLGAPNYFLVCDFLVMINYSYLIFFGIKCM